MIYLYDKGDIAYYFYLMVYQLKIEASNGRLGSVTSIEMYDRISRTICSREHGRY